VGRSIGVMAGAPEERARRRGATARRLVGELGPFRRQVGFVFLLVVVGAGMQAAGPWLISQAIDRDILRHDPTGLARTMLLLLAVYVIGALATRGQVYRVGATGQRVLAALRARLFEQFQHVPLGYFDRRPVGDLMSRVLNDVDTINQLLSQGLTQLLGSLFSLAGIIVAMLFLNSRLALVSFTIIPVMLLATSYFAKRARRAFRATRETVGDVTADIQEEIVGVREAQAFNRTAANIARFRARTESPRLGAWSRTARTLPRLPSRSSAAHRPRRRPGRQPRAALIEHTLLPQHGGADNGPAPQRHAIPGPAGRCCTPLAERLTAAPPPLSKEDNDRGHPHPTNPDRRSRRQYRQRHHPALRPGRRLLRDRLVAGQPGAAA